MNEVEKLRCNMYHVLFFHFGTGSDPAICSTSEGIDQVIDIFNNATDRQWDELLIFYASLMEIKGADYSKNLCKNLSVLKKYPLICEHLILSVYS